jgi:hypothetical protein
MHSSGDEFKVDFSSDIFLSLGICVSTQPGMSTSCRKLQCCLLWLHPRQNVFN